MADPQILNWQTIGVGILSSGFVSALVSGAISLRSKQKEYVNDYYKLVLKRRIEAYEKFQELICMFKVAALHYSKTKKIPMPFFSPDNLNKAHALALEVDPLWITSDAAYAIKGLGILIINAQTELRIKGEAALHEFGMSATDDVQKCTDVAEHVLSSDMLELYDIKKFFKAKKKRIPKSERWVA